MKGMVRSDARKRAEQPQKDQEQKFWCTTCGGEWTNAYDFGVHSLLCKIFHAEQAEEKR